MEKLRSVCIIQRIDQRVPAVYLKRIFLCLQEYMYVKKS